MSLHEKIIFSKLDLQSAYQQIDVAPDDIPKTAVIIPFLLVEFVNMAYGMKNAGSTFQRFMDSIFLNVDNVFIYLDDILIASDSPEQHADDLNKVLSVLSEHNLCLSINKCKFFKISLTFLGYEISTNGIRKPSDRIYVISEYLLPKNSF